MTNSADKLLGILSPLSPHGVALPGKPPRRQIGKKHSHSEHVAHAHRVDGHRFRCRATQTQTRSKRLDFESPQDVAAAIGFVSSPLRKALIQWVALPWWEQSVSDLYLPLLAYLKDKAGGISPGEANAICAAVLMELRASDSCTRCNTNGVEWSHKTQQWIQCRLCHGTGWRVLSADDRAKKVFATRKHYRTALKAAYSMLWAHVTNETDGALEDLQKARGKYGN